MTRKTQRVYASAQLNGTSEISTGQSLLKAIDNLSIEGSRQGREILFDTLDISIDREAVDDRTLMGAGSRISANTTIQVSAEGVLH